MYETGYAAPERPLYHLIKRLFDILLALFLAVIVFVPGCVIALLIVLCDRNRPIFTQERLGRNGESFTLYKFRTMLDSAEDPTASFTKEQIRQYYMEYKVENDPRVTKLGRFLRKSSLDELPQLVNILKGDMSVIGPRPIVEEELENYGDDAAKLLSVRPGLTGYWQAYARNNAHYETGERQAMELYYIDHQGILLDIRILFRTVYTVLSGEGAE